MITQVIKENKVIKIGDFVQIRNSRTDDMAILGFKGFIREIKLQKNGRYEGFVVVQVRSLLKYNSWELLDEVDKLDEADTLYLV